ncbi:hypothetical protein CspeluHIS016_0304460 [Cutaneotrichosporon spelunceum]|uniref:PXA domain-containing protein n=1 Tax=Cutaneotrichosporon spelunceum TaxID=1672016 RepID=A0AAD3TTF7_9TREE|nr:hypothetical protein CspeluHIS016_0304460 [Cutaneotrichosporon spelunceum]
MPRPRRRVLPLAQQLLAPTRSVTSRPTSPLAAKAEPELILLPPLLSQPSSLEEDATLSDLHDRIYHIIALALRAYIQAWYSRLSRDTALLPAINRDIVVPVARSLILDRDRLHTLLLSHLPTLLATHLHTLASAQQSPLATIPEAYHARLPLHSVALAPAPISSHAEEEFALNPIYLTALADALLAHALPPTEYEADTQRLIVREVVAHPVLGGVGRRLSAPWFWAELLLKHLDKPHVAPAPPPPPIGLPTKLGAHAAHVVDTLFRLWARLLALITLLWNGTIFLTAAWSGAPPPTKKHALDPWVVLLREAVLFLSPSPTPRLGLRLTLGAVNVMATLIGPTVDRLAPYLLDLLLTPAAGVKVVALLERVLFPDGWPGPPPIEPSADEADALKGKLREVLRRRGGLGNGLDLGRAADMLGDAGCNAHLVGMVYDAVALALVPELAADAEPTVPETRVEEKEEKADRRPIEHSATPEITVETV